jgi:hypothetical protein
VTTTVASAFGQLVEQHMRRAYFAALSLVGSREDRRAPWSGPACGRAPARALPPPAMGSASEILAYGDAVLLEPE